MDPQGRILLEQCSLALNDAEARTERPAEQETGVYVGVMHMEYIQYMTGECPASQTCCISQCHFYEVSVPVQPSIKVAVGRKHLLLHIKAYSSGLCTSTEVWHHRQCKCKMPE